MHEQWAEKFWLRVDKNGPIVRAELGQCWQWIGSRLPRGYGRFCPAWRVGLYAHRVSWEIESGSAIPSGMDVCHRCDNPSCVRPDHLFTGSRLDNMKDMIAKGRAGKTGSPGELHPSHKLTKAQVVEIRARYSSGGVLQRTLAVQFGVTRGLIGHIVRGESWKDNSK